MSVRARAPQARLRGITLIEVTIGLVVVGLVAGLAFSAGQKVLENRRQTGAMQQVYTIAQNVRGIYLGQAPAVQAAGAGTTAILGAGGFPLDMVSGTNVINDWGGTVTTSTTATDFTLTYSSLPQASCIALATRIANPGQAQQMGLLGVALTGNAEILSTAFPITPIQAAGASGCSATTATNSVAWRFKINM
jgi:Tfp pilus assembly protein FimT